ncbi:biotin/lipoyl-binding protein, partial [Chryseobacterium sp. SIMBA_028]|uniref:biotin/lipoyl-binding protein n=1 Tax=Chryseobacterium sp. SIMBA_028 TaxID=3085771 RepID=UPI003978F3CC
ARNPLRRVAVCVLVFLVFTFAVSVFMERRTPITAQATVNAYVVGIAPEVSGRVVDVAVSDNSPVAKGQMLFRIDPQQYELALA